MRDQRIGWTWAIVGVVIGVGVGSGAAPNDPLEADWVLKGGTVVDGTGAPARAADVAIRGDRIAAVGAFEVAPGAKVIDASGWVIAPGFIDLHTHSDRSILDESTRDNLNYLLQGVTTVVTGNCGGGPIDVGDFFAKVRANGAGTNVIHLVPQGSVRAKVIGNADRRASPDELERMKALVARGMEDGAWGMSSGLIYLPSRYADADELIELAKVVADRGGIYASHIRNEGSDLLEAIDEAIRVGRGAGLPVHISHLKASGKNNWGKVEAACDRIAAERAAGRKVSADQYPYVASSTQLGAMVVPHWARQAGAKGFARIADDPAQGPKLRMEIQDELDGRSRESERAGPTSIRIARYGPKPEWNGLNLAEIAERTKMSPLDVVLEIERNGGAQAISFGMNEEDVRSVMARDFVATASDGSAHKPGGPDRPHPRSYGTFPRKLQYALVEKAIGLEHAVRAGSGLPAEILGLVDRGLIRPGAYADVVAFDPAQVRDVATFDDPTRYAEGVRYLFVNGRPAVADGKPTGVLNGRVLRPETDGGRAAAKAADLILKVGRIWTGDPERPWAEAIAARDGAIVAVGSADEVESYRGPSTRAIDRPDAFAMPGLIDAHAHLADLGEESEQVDLRGVASPEEVAHKVRAWAQSHPDDPWVLGGNWDQSLWPGGEFAGAAVLDVACPDRPVWLTRVDGHAGWANSEALRHARIGAGAEAPADGQIIRDPRGRPTGVFLDGAMPLIARAIPAPTPEAIRRRLLAGQARALAAGLTGVHDAAVDRREAEAYRVLDRDGELKLRVYALASPPGGRESAFVSSPPGEAEPGDRFVMRAIKLFADGAMGSRGGYLFEPYADDPDNVGLRLIDPATLEATTIEALKNGWQVATHAIGDRANDMVLDAYARARRAVPEATDPRLRIEHAQVVRRTDIARFAELGAIASMQPAHASDDMRWADARLGTVRSQGAYAWRWFLDGGVRLAFGSDFPVEVVNPFWGLYAAITRQDPEGSPPGGWHPDQRLSLDEALRAHTAGSAFAAFDEGRLGVLKPGMRADLTVVDRDLFRVEPRALLDAKVLATIIDGEVAFEPEQP